MLKREIFIFCLLCGFFSHLLAVEESCKNVIPLSRFTQGGKGSFILTEKDGKSYFAKPLRSFGVYKEGHEILFYEKITREQLPITRFTYAYGGLCSYDGVTYMQIENGKKVAVYAESDPKDLITFDFKMGRYTTTFKKAKRESQKMAYLYKRGKSLLIDRLTSRSHHFGFRLVNRSGITRPSLQSTLDLFFPVKALKKSFSEEARLCLVDKLNHLNEFVQGEAFDYSLVASSLLLSFDKNHPERCDVKMIDFEHAMTGVKSTKELKDYRLGVENLLRVLRKLKLLKSERRRV